MTEKKAEPCVVCGEPAPVTQLDYLGIPALCPEHLYCGECYGPLTVHDEGSIIAVGGDMPSRGSVGVVSCWCGDSVRPTCHEVTTKIEETAWRVPWVHNFLRGHWRFRKPNQQGTYFVRTQTDEVTLALITTKGVSPVEMETLIAAWWSEPLPNLPGLC